MSYIPYPQPLVPKRWFTYIILFLFGLTFISSILILSLVGLLFGYCLYFIYKRNIRGHRLYLIYGGLSTFISLYYQDYAGISLNIAIMFLVFLDFDYIRKYQQTSTQFQNQGFSSQTVPGGMAPVYGSNPPVNPIIIGSNASQVPITSLDDIPINFCGSCGLKITDTVTKFCQNCGEPVN